jgi:hypothetical protein
MEGFLVNSGESGDFTEAQDRFGRLHLQAQSAQAPEFAF